MSGGRGVLRALGRRLRRPRPLPTTERAAAAAAAAGGARPVLRRGASSPPRTPSGAPAFGMDISAGCWGNRLHGPLGGQHPALCALRSALGRPGACASAWAIWLFCRSLRGVRLQSRLALANQNPGGGVWMLRRQRWGRGGVGWDLDLAFWFLPYMVWGFPAQKTPHLYTHQRSRFKSTVPSSRPSMPAAFSTYYDYAGTTIYEALRDPRSLGCLKVQSKL